LGETRLGPKDVVSRKQQLGVSSFAHDVDRKAFSGNYGEKQCVIAVLCLTREESEKQGLASDISDD
jgi:hypothetical protein